MPDAQVVAVPAEGRLAGGRAEGGVVAAGPEHAVLVVADGGAGAALVAAPRGVVAVGELDGRAALIDVVAEGGDDRIGPGVEQGGGGLVAGGGARRDVAGGEEGGDGQG